ncbi:MAG: type I DNA topoisomerase [Alphaproteobacteria bacterium CG_4_10_14_0_8_um_filter_53_9]|nr:MAG: type I DNA topoisomerase [Alphaproteobacteria bacterium CG_4_10_14_0_8_um_filter_53_9]
MKNLVIVESPSKAKTIEGYLGKDYKVLASFGHVRDLPSKEGVVEPDNDFAMHYQVSAGSEKTLKAIMAEVKQAETLYLATDLDREGEAISWHVWQEIKRRAPKEAAKLNVHRIEFTEVTKTAIQNAIKHPRELSLNLINAQQARRALDYLVGFNLSPVLWRKVKGGLSAGRVQSVALRLIAEREDAIEAFKPEEYWSIHGDFSTDEGKALPSNLSVYNGKKVEKFTFTTEDAANAVTNTLRPLTWEVTDKDVSEKRRFPSPPFITSTLQQEGARKLGLSARQTMQVAQRLYESGHISYMRTDSVNLATEAISSIRKTIEDNYGHENLPSQPNFYKSKSKNAQEAHEAIRPTNPALHPKNFSGDDLQRKLYTLIWQRTIACQMTPAKLEQTTLTIGEPSGKHQFRATGSVIIFAGFLNVYQEGKDDTTDDDETTLPNISKGAKLKTEDIHGNQHFTEPPPRFTEATLVKALEEYGIGRPSTYATIISTLQDRGYVKLDKKRFFPEDVGRVVARFLTEHFTTYVDYNFTAGLEEELDAIARGEKDWKPMLRSFWGPFITQVKDKQESVKKSDVTQQLTGEPCPKCKEGELAIRLGKYGSFKGCNRYPECDYIEKKEGEEAEVKSTGVTCPECKKNEIIIRQGRFGQFYSCAGYPDCKFSVADEPRAEPCPECTYPVTAWKTTKRYGEVQKCPSCGHWSNAQAKAASEAFKARLAETKAKKAEAKKAAKKPKATKDTEAKPKAKPKAKAPPKKKA